MKKNTKKNVEIHNLGKNIYFLMYGMPRFKWEISKLIYGRESKAVYPEIKKLYEAKWIKNIDPSKWKDLQFTSDKREQKRKYFYANSKPLLDSICDDLSKIDIKLDDIEKKRLINFLDSEAFRRFVFEISENAVYPKTAFINFEEEGNGLTLLKNHLCYLCTFHSFFLRKAANKEIDEIKEDITNKLEFPYQKEKFDELESSFQIKRIIFEKLSDPKLASEKRIEMILPYEKIEKIINEESSEDSLFKLLTLLWFPLLDKLKKINKNISRMSMMYLSGLAEGNSGEYITSGMPMAWHFI